MNKRVGAVAALLGAGLWLGGGAPAARATALGDAARACFVRREAPCAMPPARRRGRRRAGPGAMFAALTRERLAWPRISAAEMADLMSYLAADAARMWAHTPGMAAKARERGFTYPRFSGDEMLNLVAFLRHAAAN